MSCKRNMTFTINDTEYFDNITEMVTVINGLILFTVSYPDNRKTNCNNHTSSFCHLLTSQFFYHFFSAYPMYDIKIQLSFFCKHCAYYTVRFQPGPPNGFLPITRRVQHKRIAVHSLRTKYKSGQI